MECPECSSQHIVKIGFKLTRHGKRQRVQCMRCARTWYK